MSGSERGSRGEGSRAAALLSPSMLWIVVFFVGPLLVMAAFSLARRGAYGTVNWTLGIQNYLQAVDPIYLAVYGRSVWIAVVTTVLCFAVGYPTAYAIAMKVPQRWKSTLLVLAVVPFWTSFLVRTYAWRFMLQDDGLVNALFAWVGLPAQKLLYTETAVMIGQVYAELPFMILPLYAAIERLDRGLLEAASDLGASRVSRFLHVTLPLTKSGIVAGVVLVLVPSLGAFITPDMLGGAKSMMIGSLIQEQFVQRNQPFGAALGNILAIAVLVLLVVAWRAGARDEARA
jgi:spermidine/putrescine transport system permease protein